MIDDLHKYPFPNKQIPWRKDWDNPTYPYPPKKRPWEDDSIKPYIPKIPYVPYKPFKDYILEPKTIEVLPKPIVSVLPLKIQIKFLVPETNKEDIDITLEGYQLQVRSKNNDWGKIDYKYELNNNFNLDSIKSKLSNGVLIVTVDRLKNKSKKIEID